MHIALSIANWSSFIDALPSPSKRDRPDRRGAARDAGKHHTSADSTACYELSYFYKDNISPSTPDSRKSPGRASYRRHATANYMANGASHEGITRPDAMVLSGRDCRLLIRGFGVEVGQSCILRALRRIQITRKKLKVEASQRNAELRIQWRDDLQHFTAEQLVCVDESGSDDRSGDR